MTTEIIRTLTPEEEELEKKKAELDRLEANLIQRELELETFRAELSAFENRYNRTVGILYAELNAIEARIAAAEAGRHPDDAGAQERAARASAQAEESAREVTLAGEIKTQPADSLKRVFRDVAKRIHPDLSTNDADRARRQKLMAEANLAYENGDEAKLRSILAAWEGSPESVEGEGVGAELIRVIRKISQIQRRLGEIETEIKRLSATALYSLWVQVVEAENQGRDILKEIASQVMQQISDAHTRLAAATGEGPQAPLHEALTFPDGSTYMGETQHGVPHGQGKMTWPDGQEYEGVFKGGKLHGHGTMTWPNGRKYRGDWEHSVRHGQGTETYPNGEKYSGEWAYDKRDGQGALTWAHGATYVGDWKDGKRDGHGTETWSRGRRYVGEFKDGVFHGHGSYTCPDGSAYDGEWKDGTFTHGHGTEIHGRHKYVGEFKDSKYHGHGTYTWPFGQKYVGEFKYGCKNGYGIRYAADGSILESGIWYDNVLVKAR